MPDRPLDDPARPHGDAVDPVPGPSSGVSAFGDRIVTELVRRGVEGAGPWHSAVTVADDALVAAGGDRERAVRDVVASHVRMAAGSGLLTSLGGVATLLVTAPAGVTGLYLVCTRMTATIAHLRGHDLTSPVVRTAVLLSLLGPDGTDLCERTGINLQAVSLIAGLRRLPPEVREQLDRRIGFRLASRFSRRGALNLTKLLPLVSAPIGAGSDALATRTVATYADVAFAMRVHPR